MKNIDSISLTDLCDRIKFLEASVQTHERQLKKLMKRYYNNIERDNTPSFFQFMEE